MKSFFKTLAILAAGISFTGSAAQAATLTVQADVVCEQSDGDQWYSVALVPSTAPSGYNILVVRNNEDDGAKHLLIDSPAQVARPSITKVTYTDLHSTTRLIIGKNRNSESGLFSLLLDGPRSISNLKMDCFRDLSISYDANVSTEPRLGAGN